MWYDVAYISICIQVPQCAGGLREQCTRLCAWALGMIHSWAYLIYHRLYAGVYDLEQICW